MDLTTTQILYVGTAAFLVGFTKTSVGGVGILAVLLMALAFPGRASPGVLLPMALAADIMAVLYYRRACQWKILLQLLPAAVVGIGLGFSVLTVIPDANFEVVIGWMILSMLGMDLFMSEGVKARIKGRPVTVTTGILAGASSMVANAAGPIFSIFMLQLGLKKSEFVGTRCMFFLLMNIIKVPFSASLGLITPASLTINAAFLPVIFIGAFVGYKVLKYINIRVFSLLIRVAVVAAAARLILG